MAGILERCRDIMASNVHALLDKCEDPEKMLDQELRKAAKQLAEICIHSISSASLLCESRIIWVLALAAASVFSAMASRPSRIFCSDARNFRAAASSPDFRALAAQACSASAARTASS